MHDVMVFIIYDRAIDEEILDILNSLNIEHYTKWKDITGVGKNGPHLGDHVWPALNNVTMAIVDEEIKDNLLKMIKKLQGVFPFVGLRAIVIPVVEMI